MKAGWEVKPLGEVCEITSGGTPSKARADFWQGDIPWVSPKDMKSAVVNDSEDHISQAAIDGSAIRMIKAGAILVVVRSGILARKIPVALAGRDLTINQDVKALIPANKLDSRFLAYFLEARQNVLLESVTRGATVHKLDTPVIRALPISLPPLDEQKRIVAVLDEAFEGLSRARANAEANLADADEVFESFVADIFANPSADWQSRSLGSLCKHMTVGHVGPMANRYTDSGVPFLRSQNVRPFRVDWAGMKYIGPDFVAELKKSELRPGDVAIVRTGYPGTCAVIPDDIELANCADLVIARTGPDLDPHFMALLLNSRYGKAHVAEVSVGAAQKHFNVGAAKAAVFAIPPISVQKELVERAREVMAMANGLRDIIEADLHALDTLRQSLLQKAFAGELT